MVERVLSHYPQELAAARARGIAADPAQYCPHIPTERQQQFLALTCLEALFGGQAGGGKSDALLMAALQYVHVPGYAALLLRRTYADLSLPGALMDRAADWLRPTAAKWRDKEKTWEFPSGATITFGYIETEKDKYRYQGAELQFIGVDEATQVTESQYRYLLSRLRRLKGSEVPIRARCASNPGGVGHEWVKQRFVTAPPEAGRPFIPARLEDNPHLDAEEYGKALDQLDLITRAQLKSGDWDALPEGLLFKREWFAGKLLEVIPAGGRWVRFWDLAATEEKPGSDPDWTVGGKVGLLADGRWIIADVRRTRSSPLGVENLIRQTAEEDGQAVEIVIEQEPGSSGKSVVDRYVREVLRGYVCRGERSTGSKAERARPVSSQCEAGNVWLLSAPWNSIFLDELVAFPTEGVHDDQVDSVSGAFGRLAGGGWATDAGLRQWAEELAAA